MMELSHTKLRTTQVASCSKHSATPQHNPALPHLLLASIALIAPAALLTVDDGVVAHQVARHTDGIMQ